jgi:hypothetical protein
VRVGYNAIEIKQIKKFNISLIFSNNKNIIFLVRVSGIQTQNFKRSLSILIKYAIFICILSICHRFLFKIVIEILIIQKQCVQINNMTNYYIKITLVMVNPNSTPT